MIDEKLKQTKGKLRMELIPMKILKAIAEVRTSATETKYPDPDNWRQVPPEFFKGALLRHLVEYMENPQGRASDTGIKHLHHMACNIAFLIELEWDEDNV